MEIITMGTDPYPASAYENWSLVAKHRPCGTVVRLSVKDVYVSADWEGGFEAWWMCPVCSQYGNVGLSRWKFPKWMRAKRHAAMFEVR